MVGFCSTPSRNKEISLEEMKRRLSLLYCVPCTAPAGKDMEALAINAISYD